MRAAEQPTATHRRRAATIAAVLLLAGGATAFAGATEHVPALLLRTLIAIVVIATWPTRTRRPLLRDITAPGVALAVVTVGVMLAPSPGFAIQPLITVGLVCALYGAVLMAKRDLWRWILPLGVAVGSLHGIVAVIQVVAGAERGSGGFFNSIDLAAFLAPLLVLTVAAWMGGEHRPWWSAAGVCLLAGLMSTSARGGLLAGIVGVAVVIVGASANRLRRRPVVLIAALAAAMVTIAALLALTWWRWTGANDPYSFSRLAIWKRTAEVALDNPLGVGLANYREAMRVAGVPIDGPVHFPKVARHAHNEALNAWAELGWLGLIATSLPVFMLLGALRSRPPPSAAGMPTPVAIGVLLAFLIPAAVSASLHVPPVAFFAAAWAAKLARDRDAGARAERVTMPRRTFVAVFVTALVLFAVPGAVSNLALQTAAARRDGGDLPAAMGLARISAAAAPWSVGAAMMVESVMHLLGRPAILSSEALVALADRFPMSPRPLVRAAWVLEHEAAGVDHDAAALWGTAAAIRRLAVARDPHNGIGWFALARAERAAGDTEAAARTVLGALNVEPNCARALALGAALKLQAGDPAAARDLAEHARAADTEGAAATGYAAKVLSLDPDSQRMLLTLGLANK